MKIFVNCVSSQHLHRFQNTALVAQFSFQNNLFESQICDEHHPRDAGSIFLPIPSLPKTQIFNSWMLNYDGEKGESCWIPADRWMGTPHKEGGITEAHKPELRSSIWTVIVRTKYHMDILLIVILTSMWKLVSCSWIEVLGNFGVGTFDKFWQLRETSPASHNARGTSKHDSCKTFYQINLAQSNF